MDTELTLEQKLIYIDNYYENGIDLDHTSYSWRIFGRSDDGFDAKDMHGESLKDIVNRVYIACKEYHSKRDKLLATIKTYEQIADRITDILISVTNERGTSHLFDEELCDDVVGEIMKVIKAYLD